MSWQRPPPFHLVGGDELGAVEMLIRRRRGWELRKSEATPEEVFLGRRRLLKGVAAGSILASGLGAVIFAAHYGNRDVAPQMAALPAEDDPSAGLYPAKRNPRFTLDRPLTDEKFATTYNNFYEFGSQKSIATGAQALKIRPWTIKIDGLVDKPMTVDIDDLLKKMPLEERLYRHRCVEAWSMAVPWSGFPMAAFVDFAKPLGSAKYVQMETFLDPKTAPGQNGVLVSLALCRGAHDRRGGKRTRLSGHRDVRQARSQAGRGAVALGAAVEIRVQIGQIDCAFLVHRQTAGVVLGDCTRQRVRLLGQRQPGRVERVNDFDTAGGRSLGSEFWFL